MLSVLAVLSLHRATIDARRLAQHGDMSGFDNLHDHIDALADDRKSVQLRRGRVGAKWDTPTPRFGPAESDDSPGSATAESTVKSARR